MNKNRLLNISVIGFFTILIATAVPAFARSSSNAAKPWTQQERFVVEALKQIYTAQAVFVLGGRPTEIFQTLTVLRERGLIDESLGAGKKFGYSFTLDFGPTNNRNNFRVSAVPERYGKGGRRSFYFTGNCIVRGADKNGAPATESDPVVDSCEPVVANRNDVQAISSIMELYRGEMTYYRRTGYFNADLIHLRSLGLINLALGTGWYRGYDFNVWVSSAGRFNGELRAFAQPSVYGVTGIRSVYVDQSGILRGADRNGGQAGPNDPPVVY